ncbi:MAG: ribonuclease Y [Calditrichaeota bacterium]|nr:MAG: ribonuclease Y [Calditrichota bacterium]
MDVTIIVAALAGLFVGAVAVGLWLQLGRRKTGRKAEAILEEARKNAEKIEREAYLKGKEKLQRERSQFQDQVKRRERELSKNEERVRSKEKELWRMRNQLQEWERGLKQEEKRLAESQEALEKEKARLKEIVEQQTARLERMSGLNREEAKKQLIEQMVAEARSEAAQMLIDIKNEAMERARWEAKEIMAFAIERMATEYTMENTLVSVSLPNDNLKGLIIGREGRNIKAFEATTGVKVIVDDTPETVVMSSFDPIKREVARIAMERLVKSKNINPRNIENEVQRAQKIVDDSIRQAAEQTLRELKIRKVHPEMKEWLGRLKYRTSYGQNILQHSKEVAWLAGHMAAELGLDVELARRAGLFHDIGKAVSNDSEGSHVTIGVELATRCGEHPVVINSILAHHEEAEPISPISVLVTAADRISGARPGARRESLEAYTQRITKLEELANSFEGVAKTYAISAGREVRVIVIPEKLSDAEADLLASDIAKKIKETMEYPGQIKITVIRRLIASSTTGEFSNGNQNQSARVSASAR